MPVNIHLIPTPNPATLKYIVDRTLIPRGAMNFTSKETAQEKSPLAKRLMEIRGVVGVLIGSNHVTVTKGDEGEWDELNDSVMAALDEHLETNQPVVTQAALDAQAAARAAGAGGPVEQKIRDILETEIRPGLMMDGGDVLFDRYEDGVVYLEMHGACSGCPSATMTLKFGIESRLRQAIPEVVEVVQV